MLNRRSVQLERGDIHISAGAVAAPGHQIDETDFIDFAEVRRFDPTLSFAQWPVATDGHNPIDPQRDGQPESCHPSA
jgi:hypothetical protein